MISLSVRVADATARDGIETLRGLLDEEPAFTAAHGRARDLLSALEGALSEHDPDAVEQPHRGRDEGASVLVQRLGRDSAQELQIPLTVPFTLRDPEALEAALDELSDICTQVSDGAVELFDALSDAIETAINDGLLEGDA